MNEVERRARVGWPAALLSASLFLSWGVDHAQIDGADGAPSSPEILPHSLKPPYLGLVVDSEDDLVDACGFEGLRM
jgi:hypothetical protein